MFFSALIDIGSVDLYDCSDFFYESMSLEEKTALNPWFEFMGYDVPYTIVNFGSAIFILPIVSVLMVVLKFSFYLPQPKIVRKKFKSIVDNTVWNFYVGFFHEMFLNFSICTMLQLTDFNFDTFG